MTKGVYDEKSLERLAVIAVENAISHGAQHADAVVSYGREIQCDLEKNAIKSCDAGTQGAISVRAIFQGGAAWASFGKTDEESAAEAGTQAADLAKLADPDPDFVGLVDKAECYPEVEGLYCEKVANAPVEDIVETATQNIDQALAVDESVVCEGGIEARARTRAIANSNGVVYSSRSTYISHAVVAVLRKDSDVGSYYAFESARRMNDFDASDIGERACTRAKDYMAAENVETGEMDIVLGPYAARSLWSIITRAADGESVLRGRSFLCGMEGKKIASDVITLTEDPFVPGGLASRIADGEGHPTSKKTLVENGVLATYLYSSYSAGKAGKKVTGNGERSGGTSVSNIIPAPGEKTSEELIKEVESGLYIELGGLKADAVSGDVSSTVDYGFRIEKGKITHPVKSTMVGGNILDMLTNIDAVSSDFLERPGTVMPTVRIRKVRVAGAK